MGDDKEKRMAELSDLAQISDESLRMAQIHQIQLRLTALEGARNETEVFRQWMEKQIRLLREEVLKLKGGTL